MDGLEEDSAKHSPGLGALVAMLVDEGSLLVQEALAGLVHLEVSRKLDCLLAHASGGSLHFSILQQVTKAGSVTGLQELQGRSHRDACTEGEEGGEGVFCNLDVLCFLMFCAQECRTPCVTANKTHVQAEANALIVLCQYQVSHPMSLELMSPPGQDRYQGPEPRTFPEQMSRKPPVY